jgi:hypothetical protein
MASVYNEANLPSGCNSTEFFTNTTDTCKEIGGVWQPDIKWCKAIRASAAAMEQYGEDRNMTLVCKYTKSNSASKGVRRQTRLGLIPLLMMVLMMVDGVRSMSVSQPGIGNDTDLSDGVIRDHPRPCMKKVVQVGTDKPKSTCKYHQVTGSLDCNNQDCSKTKTEGRSFSWSIGGSAGGEAKGGSFSPLSFDVSESYTAEESEGCGSKKDSTPLKGQQACVIAQVSYLEYMVKEEIMGGDCGSIRKDPYLIQALDKTNVKNSQCGADDECHHLDWGSWDHDKACPLADVV